MFGVAALLANIMGGYIYQAYGGKALFAGKGFVCGAWTIVLLIYYSYKRFRNGQLTGKPLEWKREQNVDDVNGAVECGVDHEMDLKDEFSNCT